MQHIHTGKVRELYRLDDGRLLMVATDRISAFDYVLESEIPDKGRILTALSVWWFGQLADVVESHLISVADPAIPPAWRGRAMVCAELAMVPIEAVARGYLAGSGLVDYRRSGAVCGNPLPPGLRDGDRLPEPIFTPATKAPVGEHDENLSYQAMALAVGEPTAGELRRLTLAIYERATQIAAERGIILADTKFEFGQRPGSDALVLGDEVLTPDSSRFWPADRWAPGSSQPSFDKQYVRDWLLSPESGWDRGSGAKPPALPAEVVAQTRARYVEAYERLTGLRFTDWTG
ncbi:MAG TPA: phosphoribosylaminoimidazolesuccinocarboxamide synthase [Kofleriaceae bacterium]|jgi:phosphoribosylaminoimidazole-succinocarboxamide synthase|nr:phosphoribosylaminoimidazolesuccinocarboxamide synthase [Kofleriaceae bacterium]